MGRGLCASTGLYQHLEATAVRVPELLARVGIIVLDENSHHAFSEALGSSVPAEIHSTHVDPRASSHLRLSTRSNSAYYRLRLLPHLHSPLIRIQFDRASGPQHHSLHFASSSHLASFSTTSSNSRPTPPRPRPRPPLMLHITNDINPSANLQILALHRLKHMLDVYTRCDCDTGGSCAIVIIC